MNMKRNKKIIGISVFVLLLLVGIIYGYMHSINIYRLEVTQIEGSGYGYKIYERERLIIVQPWHNHATLLARLCQYGGTGVPIRWHKVKH